MPLVLRQNSSGADTSGPSAEGTATGPGSAATTPTAPPATATNGSSGAHTDSGSQGRTATNADTSTNTATVSDPDTTIDTSTNATTNTQNTQNSLTSTRTSPTSTQPPTTDTTTTPTSTNTSTTATSTASTTQQTTTTTSTFATTSTTSTPQSTPTSTGPATSETSHSTTVPPTSSSSTTGRISTIGTSTIVTSVNGQLTTSLEPIVTTLGENDSTGLSPAANKGIIAGCVVGVFSLLVLAFAMVVFYRRHRHKKLDFFKWPQPKPRTMLLAGEDLDDVDMGPSMASYRDYPTSVASHSVAPSRAGQYSPTQYRDQTGSGSINGPPMDPNASYSRSRINVGSGVSSPHLMGMRTSEAGSIFQEEVWPPPRKPFVDPLVSTENLTHIVDDVMGPRNAAGDGEQPRTDSRLRGGRASISSLESAPDIGDGHARSPSQTTLLPPASPREETRRTPLFITNLAGTDTPSIYSQQSPPLRPSRRGTLDEHQPLSLEDESMGEAL